ncbi:MAG: hypothetical protein VB021_02425 [Oscillospiraceae bacterium]|nr:hypothetical protein [Oscillospiraceae bacterium]
MYDRQTDGIGFYQSHSEYRPFVGADFEKYRILIIGESHYIGQSCGGSDNPYEIDYFMRNWFDGDCTELNAAYANWFNTQEVIHNYMNGNRRKGYLIFTNLAKSFSKTILGDEIGSISSESGRIFDYFAFMNFFQMPSLYSGKGFWDSLKLSAKRINRPELAYQCWDTVVCKSVSVTDNVIDILAPRLTVFVSKSAYDAYMNCEKSKYKNEVKHCDHPACPWWNQKKSGGIMTGKEQFERVLKDCCGK